MTVALSLVDILLTRAEPIAGLTGVVWIALGLVMGFHPRYRDIPKVFGFSYSVIGGGFMVLAVASFSSPSRFGLVLATFAGVVLLTSALVGFRWLVREYVDRLDHRDITPQT